MITIGGTKYTPSEVIQMIKDDPDTPWKKQYPYYLFKINRSGDQYEDFGKLVLKLASYVMGEKDKTPVELERYRGQGPTLNSAMLVAPIDRNKVKTADVAAINHLMTTGTVGNGISDRATHVTDPETGYPKEKGVTVTEFYVNGADGRRATKRTEGGKTTYYYSVSHLENTYKYARLI